MRTSLQIMDTELQMSFGGTLYPLLFGKTFFEIVLAYRFPKVSCFEFLFFLLAFLRVLVWSPLLYRFSLF